MGSVQDSEDKENCKRTTNRPMKTIKSTLGTVLGHFAYYLLLPHEQLYSLLTSSSSTVTHTPIHTTYSKSNLFDGYFNLTSLSGLNDNVPYNLWHLNTCSSLLALFGQVLEIWPLLEEIYQWT
jgi:hypothetical protein